MLEKIIKEKLRRLRNSLEAAIESEVYGDAHQLDGAIFHIEMLYGELLQAGDISTLDFDKED